MAASKGSKVDELKAKLAETKEVEARIDLLYSISEELYGPAPQESEVYLRQAISEARAADMPNLASWPLVDLAFLRFQAGHLAEAQEICLEALELGCRLKQGRVEASANTTLGLVYGQKGDHARAIEHYQECLRISQEIKYEGGVATAYGNMAQSFYSLGKIEQALEYYQACLSLYEKLGNRYSTTTTFTNMGQCYDELGDWERALEYYYRAIANAEELDQKTTIAETLDCLGLHFAKRGRLEQALQYHTRAVQVAAEIGHADLQAKTLGDLAQIHLAMGNHSAAVGLLDRSRLAAEAIEDKEEIARVRRRMAEVHLLDHDTDAALREVKEAIRINQEIGCIIELGIAWRLAGEIHDTRGELKEAGFSFERAIALLSGNREKGAMTASEEGPDNAKPQSPAADLGPGFSYELARALLAGARLLARVGRSREAVAQAQRAARRFRGLGILEGVEDADKLIFSERPSVESIADSCLAILQSLTGLAATSAPVSELALACLRLLTGGLHYQNGALVFYGRGHYAVGKVRVQSLLAMPRPEAIVSDAGRTLIPVRLQGRVIGMLQLSEPDDDFSPVDLAFWECVENTVAAVVDRIRIRTRVSDGSAAGNVEIPEPDTESPFLRFGRFICASEAIERLLDDVERVAPTNTTVLVSGESGTGKDMIAEAIHELSPRASRPMVVLNCAALPETLLEAELFGIEKGVATGVAERAGKLQQADGSTLFLDEIADMSLTVQAKLLRVLQERTFERVGGHETIAVDVRVVAATNRDLETAVKAGNFREDLFHRLNVIALRIAPLRERREAIPLLIEHFVRKYSEEFMRPVQALTADAMNALLDYSWPGNVRQLENTLERAVIVAQEGLITAQDLPAEIQQSRDRKLQTAIQPLRAVRQVTRNKTAGIERDFLIRALCDHNWQIPETHKALGISRAQLYRLLKKHGVRREVDVRG